MGLRVEDAAARDSTILPAAFRPSGALEAHAVRNGPPAIT